MLERNRAAKPSLFLCFLEGRQSVKVERVVCGDAAASFEDGMKRSQAMPALKGQILSHGGVMVS